MNGPNNQTLDSLLEEIVVIHREIPDPTPDWPEAFPWAVYRDLDTVALFRNERDALRYRLDWINRLLNP